MQSKLRQGFTIVELLIVIVIIAILAAITIVAYTGIQNRANNTAIIDSASKTYRLLQAYIVAQSGSYPVSSGRICITTDSGCVNGAEVYTSGTTLNANISTLGALPRSVPNQGVDQNGVVLYYGAQTLDSVAQPLLLYYFLSGNNQQCGLNNVVTYTWPDYTRSSTGNSGNVGSKTRCWVSVTGPVV